MEEKMPRALLPNPGGAERQNALSASDWARGARSFDAFAVSPDFPWLAVLHIDHSMALFSWQGEFKNKEGKEAIGDVRDNIFKTIFFSLLCPL
ncbi:MAG: hypothetical protein V1928_04355 [Parcubacteria group bacterium]